MVRIRGCLCYRFNCQLENVGPNVSCLFDPFREHWKSLGNRTPNSCVLFRRAWVYRDSNVLGCNCFTYPGYDRLGGGKLDYRGIECRTFDGPLANDFAPLRMASCHHCRVPSSGSESFSEHYGRHSNGHSFFRSGIWQHIHGNHSAFNDRGR